MNIRRFFFLLIFLLISFCLFGQAAALRDYVGLINQSYHPDIVTYFEKMKTDLEKKGEKNAAKSIENILKGAFGSGFIISDAKKNSYIITNHHVIAQAHSLSITFEKQDGFKKKYENLKIIAVDEELDLAILAFAPGQKPDVQGLSFVTNPVQEGADIYSAGFPGLGQTAIWQLGRGMVSNASVRFPKSSTDETLMGPFIQHTAQVDPGNSGGPLLVIQNNVPSGYAVAGVNSLSSRRRQAANFSIPANVTQTFINNTLNQKPETYRTVLDEQLDKFVKGLGANKAVYPYIAEYLSSACVGENAEYSMSEMVDKGGPSVRRAFIEKCEEDVIGAMGYAVAWTIENNIRTQGVVIKASKKNVSGSGEEYTVVFTINDKDVESKWIREYGNWRIRSFGTVAAGDKNLIEQKKIKKETSEKIRTDSYLHIEAGYAYLFEKEPAALYVSADFVDWLGVKMYYAGSDFWSIGAFANYRWGFKTENFGFMPYVRVGLDYYHDQEYKDYEELVYDSTGFAIAIMGQVGLKITSSYVPGLFIGVAFQYNFFDLFDENYDNAMKMGLSITAGYAF